MESTNLFTYIGLALIFVGIAVIMAAFILFMLRGIGKAEKVRGGGVIFVGPFPIIFGTNKEFLRILVLLAIVLAVIMIGLIIGFQMLRM